MFPKIMLLFVLVSLSVPIWAQSQNAGNNQKERDISSPNRDLAKKNQDKALVRVYDSSKFQWGKTQAAFSRLDLFWGAGANFAFSSPFTFAFQGFGGIGYEIIPGLSIGLQLSGQFSLTQVNFAQSNDTTKYIAQHLFGTTQWTVNPTIGDGYLDATLYQASLLIAPYVKYSFIPGLLSIVGYTGVDLVWPMVQFQSAATVIAGDKKHYYSGEDAVKLLPGEFHTDWSLGVRFNFYYLYVGYLLNINFKGLLFNQIDRQMAIKQLNSIEFGFGSSNF